METSLFEHSKLPEAFREYGKLDTSDLLKLEAYFQRFVWDAYPVYREGHLLLACYAALPAALTPDLLYRLWLNFNAFQSGPDRCFIDRVAVSDFLLSSLADELSPELFEIPISIRNALLFYWKTIDDQASGKSNAKAMDTEAAATRQTPLLRARPIEEVARFLAGYADTAEAHRVSKAFAKAQRWTALSFFNPRQAAAELAAEIKDAQNTPGGNPSLQRRLADAVAKMGDRIALGLTSNPPSGEFRYFQDYIRANLHLLHGDEDKSKEILKNIDPNIFKDEPDPNAVASFRVKAGQAPREREIDHNKPTLYALLVGITNYPEGVPSIQGPVNDILAFKRYFNRHADLKEWNFKSSVLLDAEATRANIIGTFQDFFARIDQKDHCVFCFSGHGSKSRVQIDSGSDAIEISALVCFDSRMPGGRDLYAPELSWLIAQVTREEDNPMLVIVDAARFVSFNTINSTITRTR